MPKIRSTKAEKKRMQSSQQLPPRPYRDRDHVHLPPKYHFGWLLDKSQRERLVQTAQRLGVVTVYSRIMYSPDDEYAEFLPDGRQVNLVFTMAQLCGQIVGREYFAQLPVRSLVHCVVEPGYLGIVLYDNYHISKKPSDEAVENIRSILGFEEPPRWLPDAHPGTWRVESHR